MKRGNNGKLSVAQCRHLLYLPPHHSQRVRVEDQNMPALSLLFPLHWGLPQSRCSLCQGGREPALGHRRGSPPSGGECVCLGRCGGSHTEQHLVCSGCAIHVC